MIPIKNFTDDAAWLLGRALTEQDGVPETICSAAERDLRFVVPTALKDFYIAVGGQAAFMSSFQQFAEPQQWLICEEKLVFLEENQGVSPCVRIVVASIESHSGAATKDGNGTVRTEIQG